MKHLKYIVFVCILTFTISCGQQKKYIEYKVKEGETISTIAQNYNMSVRDLLRLNPDVGRKLKTNTLIIVPNQKRKEQPLATAGKTLDKVTLDLDTIALLSSNPELDIIKKYYVVHEVKKGDTFYSLTRFYNVTEAALIALNPLLKEGLKLNTFIKIKKIESQVEKEENLIYQDVFESNINLKAALLLPFKINELDTIPSEQIFENNPLATIVTDFYLGAEIAVDSLKNQGIHSTLNVYDTGNRETKINTILSNNNLNENDVIIGPIYNSEAEVIASKVSIPVVFPVFSSSQTELSNSKLVKTQPDKEVYKSEMIAFLLANYNGENIVVVSDNKAKSMATTNALKKHDSIFNIAIVTPENGYIQKENIINAMKSEIDNWIILDTNDDVLGYNVVNSLISLPSSFTLEKAKKEGKRFKMQALSENTGVTLVTFEKGTTFDKIDNNKLAKLNFTYGSDIFMDNESFSTKNFNASYFRKNNAYPSYYATKGFDITYDILMRLASGNSLKSTFSKGISYRVESKFSYDPKLFKATNNNGVYIVQYNKDLSLTRLK